MSLVYANSSRSMDNVFCFGLALLSVSPPPPPYPPEESTRGWPIQGDRVHRSSKKTLVKFRQSEKRVGLLGNAHANRLAMAANSSQCLTSHRTCFGWRRRNRQAMYLLRRFAQAGREIKQLCKACLGIRHTHTHICFGCVCI